MNLGDFRQCLPVIPKGSPAQILASSIVHAPFWKDVQTFNLTINMRLLAQSEQMTATQLSQAESFAKWLLKVGEGKDDMLPFTQLPTSIPIMISLINLCNRFMHA